MLIYSQTIKYKKKKTVSSPLTNIDGFTNTFAYTENVNAVYAQFGSKINKISYLLGMRYENSNIEITQYVGNITKIKKYGNFFPSVFLTYELPSNSSISLNYSKRITRPRDRFINPFSSYSSNINLFQGNPDINPAYSDAFDIGYLKKWDKITLSSSLYLNHTTNSFQVVRLERGDKINDLPVIVNTPFNLSTDDKLGFELTLNYSVKKWLKLNANFNYFNNKTKGEYTYTNTDNILKSQNFDFNANTWTTRITSKVNLPFKIDWQLNGTYNADQKNGQGVLKGFAAANTAFSRDVLKEKGTISFSINDVFNSRKRIQEIQLPNVNSSSQMQRGVRQFTVSFTYRFNKNKNSDKEREGKPRQNEGGDVDMG